MKNFQQQSHSMNQTVNKFFLFRRSFLQSIEQVAKIYDPSKINGKEVYGPKSQWTKKLLESWFNEFDLVF